MDDNHVQPAANDEPTLKAAEGLASSMAGREPLAAAAAPPPDGVSVTQPNPVPVIGTTVETTEFPVRTAKEKLKRAEWINIILTGVIAIGTVVSAIAIGLQWRVMVGGGTQTNELVNAAKGNAAAAKDISTASQRNATAAESFAANAGLINTGVQSAVGKLNLQASATHDVAEQTRATADIARQQMDLSERPWIKADIGLAQKNDNTPGVYFTRDRGLEAATIVQIQNIGRSPALRVHVTADLLSSREPQADVERDQLTMCNSVQPATSSLESGDSEFPFSAPVRFTRFLTFPEQKINKALANPTYSEMRLPNGQKIGLLSDDGGLASALAQATGSQNVPGVLVVGCVAYSAPYSQVTHHTRFMYELFGVDLHGTVEKSVSLNKVSDRGNGAD